MKELKCCKISVNLLLLVANSCNLWPLLGNNFITKLSKFIKQLFKFSNNLYAPTTPTILPPHYFQCPKNTSIYACLLSTSCVIHIKQNLICIPFPPKKNTHFHFVPSIQTSSVLFWFHSSRLLFFLLPTNQKKWLPHDHRNQRDQS